MDDKQVINESIKVADVLAKDYLFGNDYLFIPAVFY